MEEFDKELEQYGIFAKNGTKSIQKNNITLINADIEKIDFNILQENKIEKLYIENSEIKNIIFAKENDTNINFTECTIKNHIFARDKTFNHNFVFLHCIFEKIVDFSKTKFKKRVDFKISKFKDEARFFNANFLAEQKDDKTIENDFREVVFLDESFFTDVIFIGKVSFGYAIFKDEANFMRAKFLVKKRNCNIFENSFSDVVFNNKVFFNDATFEASVNFEATIFKSRAYLCNMQFKDKVSFGLAEFKDKVNFVQTKFLAKQKDDKTIENNFREVVFNDKISFSNVDFDSKVDFTLADFQSKVYFISMNFKHEVYFNFTKFKDEILLKDLFFLKNTIKFIHSEINNINIISTENTKPQLYFFEHSIFKGVVNFQDLSIDTLNFNNVIFSNIVNFNNVKFGNNKPIFTNCTFFNQFNTKHDYIQYNYNELEEKIEKNKNNYDEFLNFRDLFRKLKSNRIAHHNLIDASELRVQELYARELELKHKENKSLKEKIERWQLFFYRKLCDHHTDILQSLNSLILVIGIFGVLNLAIIIGFNRYLDYKLILEHLYFSLDFYNLHIKPFIENNYSFIMFVNFIILFVYLILVGFVLCVKYIREFFITISYVITFFIMVTSPKILIPAMGIFTDKRVMLDPLSVLGGIYTIVFGFVVYSFVKTIRKNSIVPS